ncbi:XRE family transcriptional regulator [Aliishimia ponticola]|uniref:XRE family transcriptional regulator n=1 Tax=Aliishimia ponticola TaxID=2499833 RepID=A0A4S4NA40_9RHOB|nr:XRE family transcriptional regulator [Aliishimia ponticola]THH36144.1 XRE family transcriptional regulator [Aliishimia ponticola]
MASKNSETSAHDHRTAFGDRVQQLRKSQNLTLLQVSQASGLAVSTISKIENSHLSPTYDVMLKLSAGLGTELVSLLENSPTLAPKPASSGRLAVSRAGELSKFDAGPYTYEPIATQLKNTLIDATFVTVTARDVTEFEDPIRHAGEELVVVISGAVELHSDLYEPIRLNAGDSVYYDAGMAHAYISVSKEDARILNIVSGASMKGLLNAE